MNKRQKKKIGQKYGWLWVDSGMKPWTKGFKKKQKKREMIEISHPWLFKVGSKTEPTTKKG